MITDPGPRDPITDSQSDTKPDANDSQTAIAQFSEKMEVVAAKGNAQCCQLVGHAPFYLVRTINKEWLWFVARDIIGRIVVNPRITRIAESEMVAQEA